MIVILIQSMVDLLLPRISSSTRSFCFCTDMVHYSINGWPVSPRGYHHPTWNFCFCTDMVL